MSSRMRSRFKAIVAALCALTLAVTPTFAAWGADDASSGEMKAWDQVLIPTTTDVGGAQRIASFKLGVPTNTTGTDDRPTELYSFESLGTDSGKQTLTLSTSALQKAVKENLLPQWAPLAASVFRDQASQLVDLYGHEPNGNYMSKAGFDAYFNMGKGGATTEYSGEDWSCYNLSSKLAQTTSSRAGSIGDDQLYITGIKQVNSLSGARNMMGQALRDCEKTNAVSADEFLSADEGGETRLDALQSTDQTTAFANVVTAVNCKGTTANFDYVSFGIVFYDFEPVPVAAQDLKYVTGGYSAVPVEKAGQPSEIENRQQQQIVHSALLGDSVTETVTTTMSGLASFNLKENIGANIGMSSTESSTETDFWADDDSSGSSSSTSSETLSMGLDWGTAWEMGGAFGAEAGHSKSEQVSKAVETTIVLPPHTATTIDHNTTTTTFTQTYQQPAVLSYKVAIFAMSGDFYSSSAFGGIGGINTGSYDKQSLVIKFDTQDENTPFYGCVATDDLYGRSVTNRSVQNYDVSGSRTYSTHSTAAGFSKSEDINWDDVMAKAQSYYGVGNAYNDIAKKNFFFESPGKLNAKKDKASSNAQPLYPLYDLAHVLTPQTNYTLYTGESLDSKTLTVQGYNGQWASFYGFDSALGYGQWMLCDSEGKNTRDVTDLTDNDPVYYDGTAQALKPKQSTTGGTIHLTWVFADNEHAKPKTGDSPDGQNLAADQASGKITVPVVQVDVANAELDNPTITAEGSYTGYYKTPINLNNLNPELSYTVFDAFDRIIQPQVKWESQEPSNYGINVDAGTGNVTFDKPGTYHVRPYVVNNSSQQVFPKAADGKFVWLTVTATEHNVILHQAQAPTCTEDGWIQHYRCLDCGKYYSDIAGQNEISADSVVVKATGHDWGEWVTTKEATDAEPGVQKRVCKNDASHEQERNLYTVQFNMKGHGGTAPEKQVVVQDELAKGPQQPTAEGYTFDGWFTDEGFSDPFDFGTPVTGNLTLYAKWTPIMYTVATTSIVVDPGSSGGQAFSPATVSHVSIGDGEQTYTDDEGYTYYYKEVAYGTPITLTVSPQANYDLNGIQAASVSSINPETSEITAGTEIALTPGGEGTNTYSFTVPAADVAVVGSFAQATVTVAYDGNKPSGASGDVVGLPDSNPVTVDYGTKLALPTPTLEGYTFGGWFKDAACTGTPVLSGSKATETTTLYAKWTATAIPTYTVTYRLSYPDGTEPPYDEASYQAEKNSTAYNPTNDLYAIFGEDALVRYELAKSGDGSCWFTDVACTTAYDFNSSSVTAPLTLYAKVVPHKYTVTYYDDETNLGTQSATYGTAIGAISDEVRIPTREGYTLSGWETKGEKWNIEETPVTGNLDLYAGWDINKYSVTFDANGHGTAPDEQAIEHGAKVTKPDDLSAEGYTFGGWFTDKDCTEAYDFESPVTGSLTLYAKWAVNKCTVTFDANGHGTAPVAQTVDYGSKAEKPANPAATGLAFGGWFTDKDCTAAYDFESPVKGDLTLYAKWSENVAPGAVTVTSAKSPLKKNVVVSWKAANDADGYEVAIGGIIKSVDASCKSVSIVSTKLKVGKKYNVKVRAWHMNGTVKTYGSWSPVKKVTISKYYNAKTKKSVWVYKKSNGHFIKKAKLKKGTTVKVLATKGKVARTNKGWMLKKNLNPAKIVNKVKVLAKVPSSSAQLTTSGSESSLMAAQIG